MADYTLTARLTADAREFVSGIRQAQTEMNGLQKFSKKVGSKIGNFGKSVSRIGDSLTNKITKPALAAGTAVAGITLAKGFQRLVGIDTARAKLVALGHDAKSVDGIMESALTSVKGTAFGLDEAATTAANAVAAGIEPGKELTKYLTLTGDAAAVAGTDLGEMGSIFNKVQTQNKAYNRELQQLADRGLPIYEWLAEEAGETSEAIFDMASNGQISTEMFLNAIESNIGGAAAIMGSESFTAAAANVWAAVGRIGASFLDGGESGKGFFSQLKPLMAEFTEKIDSMGDVAEAAGVKFGEMFMDFVEKLREIKAQYDELSPGLQDIIKNTILWGSISLVAIGPILKIIGPVIQVFSFLATSVIPNVVGAFKLLNTAIKFLPTPITTAILVIGLLVAAFIFAYTTSEKFREIVHTVFNFIKDIIVTVISEVADFIMEVWGFIVDWWEENNELIQKTAETIWGSVSEKIESVMTFLVPFLQGAWLAIQTIVEIVWTAIKTAVMIAMEIIGGIITAVMHVINGDWDKAWETIKTTFINIWNRMKEFGSTVTQIIKDNIQEKFEQVKEAIRSKLEEAKQSLIDKFNDMKQNAIDKAQQILTDTKAKFTEIKQNIADKIQEAKTEFVNKFIDMKDNAIKKGQEIVNTVKDKFEEAKNKIIEPIENAKETISGIIDEIKGFFDNLKLKIPKPEMPSMPSFSLKTSSQTVMGKSISYPSGLKVNWNAQGGIFSRPTIFNTANAGMQGVGEAGPEAILPLNSKVLGGIGRGIANTMSDSDSRSENKDVVDAVRDLEDAITSMSINMDSKVVGGIVEPHVTVIQNKRTHSKVEQRRKGR